MAMSYFTESEAPRDFRVSSTESEGHYKKCLLCYTVKKNFYCQDCVRTGNFVHSSMPYSDRYAEKQAKLLRLKANRKHILERCERLLATTLKKDTLLTEAKQSRDKLDLLRLAIEQRRTNIEEKRKVLTELKNHNTDLNLKLPRYQKRVSSLGKHAQMQRLELENKVSLYNDQAEMLAALRRSRIRQLTKYIFPVYLSYDTSDSIEDMEFIGEEAEAEPPRRPQLHIVAPWISSDGDCSHAQAWLSVNKEAALWQDSAGACNPAQRTGAALALAAQLLALLAWTLDRRLPHALSLNEYCNWRMSEGGACWRARRAARAARARRRRQHGRPHAGQSGGVAERAGGGGERGVGGGVRRARGRRQRRLRAARAPLLARARRDGAAELHAARAGAGAVAGDVSRRLHRLHVARLHQVTAPGRAEPGRAGPARYTTHNMLLNTSHRYVRCGMNYLLRVKSVRRPQKQI